MPGEIGNDVAVQIARELMAGGRQITERNLTWGHSGNVSARVPGDDFLISASGVRLDQLDNQLIRCSLDSSAPDPADASVEVEMHRMVYQEGPAVGAVLHASPYYATLVASSELTLDSGLTTDTAYYLGDVTVVDFFPPGSRDLAVAVGNQARSASVMLLANHGAVCLGSTVPEAVVRLECLEMLCRMVIDGCRGVPLRPLNEAQVQLLHKSLGSRQGI